MMPRQTPPPFKQNEIIVRAFSALAAVAGLLLAWSNLHTPWARPLVDAVGVGLSWPERPALELRMVVPQYGYVVLAHWETTILFI